MPLQTDWSDLTVTGNYAEAVLWAVIAVVLLWRSPALPPTHRRLAGLTAGTLLVFGVSDVVEAQTGAWWSPWWLLAWKASCIVALTWGGWQWLQARSGRLVAADGPSPVVDDAPPATRAAWRAHLVGDFSCGRLLRFVAVLYASLAAYGWFASEAKIFLPHEAGYRMEAPYFALQAPDGTPIAARWVESPGARYTLLYSHGNAEDLHDMAPVLEAYQAMGFSVLAYDYRGYGASGGSPSERAAYEDITVAYRHLTETRQVPADRIIAFGHSLGGGPTAELATRLPVAGVVLESTFVSAIRVLTNVKLLPFDRFDTIARLPAIDRPTLFIHGRQDETIPFWHGEALHAAARSPKRHLWLDAAGHDDVVDAGGEPYRRALQAFAASLAK